VGEEEEEDDAVTTPRGTTALHPLLHHSSDTVRDLPGVEIPAAETPMIARNAAMRRGGEQAGGGNRRASLDKRGRRVSSIASGFDGSFLATLLPKFPPRVHTDSDDDSDTASQFAR
jgi:hypothetical protein